MHDSNNENKILFDRYKNIFLLGQFTMTPYYQSTSTCIYNELTLSKAFYRYNKTKCHEFRNVVSKKTVIFSAF